MYTYVGCMCLGDLGVRLLRNRCDRLILAHMAQALMDYCQGLSQHIHSGRSHAYFY